MKHEKILFIHPRKGLFRVTKCNQCGFVFHCSQCDANLITYRRTQSSLFMICHQCQSHYDYPSTCPECKSKELQSFVGGTDELDIELRKQFGNGIIRYDDQKSSSTSSSESMIAITTRLFDPSIPYSEYTRIIFVHAENLFISPDYQVLEESVRQIITLFQQLSPSTSVYFDTTTSNNDVIQSLQGVQSVDQFVDWYNDFLERESKNRQAFGFPPHKNILLFTSQHKNKTASHEIIKSICDELHKISERLEDTTVSSPYEARFLKRKGMYSYHTFMRYPKQYQRFGFLRKYIDELSNRYPNIQIRLNPRHLF